MQFTKPNTKDNSLNIDSAIVKLFLLKAQGKKKQQKTKQGNCHTSHCLSGPSLGSAVAAARGLKVQQS